MRLSGSTRAVLGFSLAVGAVFAGGATRIVQDQCGPFADVTPSVRPYILELYFLGITAGTSATTFSPNNALTRGQAAVFVAKGLDQSLARSGRRAALGQWWTSQAPPGFGLTPVGRYPTIAQSDGSDIWVVGGMEATVSRIRASDGKSLETWSNAGGAWGLVVAMGRVFVGGGPTARLFMIDPTMPAGDVTLVATDRVFGQFSALAFDGARIWAATQVGSLSIITPASSPPWPVSTTTGFGAAGGLVFDGANMWLCTESQFLKLDANGNTLLTIDFGSEGGSPIFDGSNIWIPLPDLDSVAVVSPAKGTVLTTLTGNGLNAPFTSAFDGQRVLITNYDGDSVSLWKAADASPLGSFPTGSTTYPYGACSDGVNFWITLAGSDHLLRF